jgi:hypothetical protein
LLRFPDAEDALDEAITIELKAGDTLFIPSFTWIQLEWVEVGMAVSHFGWADALTEDELSAVVLVKDTWKRFLLCYSNLSKNDAGVLARKFLSLGRHPTRSVFAGAPVSLFMML